jgi:hypothetical protein
LAPRHPYISVHIEIKLQIILELLREFSHMCIQLDMMGRDR